MPFWHTSDGSYIEPASNFLATWVNFTISATWDNFTISATWVTFTISATSSHSCCNLFNLNLFEWLYYHKIHILFGKYQDAFMNNLEVIFVNGFHSPSNCICYIKIFTKVTNISIFVSRFYLSSNCICYIKFFTKVTIISNVTHVGNHWHQLVIWENTSKSFT